MFWNIIQTWEKKELSMKVAYLVEHRDQSIHFWDFVFQVLANVIQSTKLSSEV